MADWRTLAARAAQQAGAPPALYQALIWQESRGKANARSPAGALGYSQLMPDTARGLGVDPNNPWQNLLGGAKYLRQQLDRFGGNVSKALAAYNAGPGAVVKYGGVPPFAETQAYVRNITGSLGRFGGKGGAALTAAAGGAGAAPSAAAAPPDMGGGGDASALVAALTGQRHAAPAASMLQAPSFAAHPVMAGGGPALLQSGPPAPKTDIGPLIAAAAAQGQAPAGTTSGLVADASSAPAQAPRTGSEGAQAALGWAQSKLGFKETGRNSGGLASYLNQRFGMSAAPWCAMFTSAAVTKGGAPAEARTASVAGIREKAAAGVGYERGYVKPGQARAGDLILFGDQHVGMVQGVRGGRITYVGGNQSDGVTTATVPVGHGDIVRPRYGARR